MLLTDLLTRYGDFAIRLGIDLLAILLLSYALYFRRHWRADLLSSYIALNVGIFAVMSLLGVVRVDIAVGFGLFAILSIIRLRSSTVTQQEVGYYFIALVLGLVNGLKVEDRGLVVAINVLLLAVMLVFDSRSLRERSLRLDVRIDKIYTDSAALVAELERQLGGRVVYHEVSEIDLIHKHMTIDVRLRPGRGGTTHRLGDQVSSTGTPPTAETQPTTVASGNGVTGAARTDDTVTRRTGDGGGH